MDYQTIEEYHSLGVYGKRPVVVVKGKGMSLWDSDGVEYLDMGAGIAVANLGHCPDRVVQAITEQAETLITCPELFYNDRRAELLTKLSAIFPEGYNRFFLCNSGTEAIEAALKFARLATGKTDFIVMQNAFHGRTFGALTATAKQKYRQPFEPLVPGFIRAPYNDVEAVKESLTENTAAILVEPIQGEGGVFVPDENYLAQLSDVCQECGVLLLVDEIQTGFGRTGQWFAFLHDKRVKPDMVCMAKGLGSGFPIGAVAVGPRLPQFHPGDHGSTFGGNPLACAAALATIQVIEEENLIDHSAEMGTYLLEQLRTIHSPLIREIRGKGLMAGIELKTKAQKYLKALQTDHKIVAMVCGTTVLRLVPPLIIEKSHIDRTVEALRVLLE
ncbi:MAG: acetylornithine/succinylornithine family transaminase [Candidatus Vecturithrix sp.]|jgi:acetylornithine/LysW-gamma-L-lysine aminotransferase|nr:acetylornithine/succinylornithine family transaminase [Candidatus Vecturithrix sp.]